MRCTLVSTSLCLQPQSFVGKKLTGKKTKEWLCAFAVLRPSDPIRFPPHHIPIHQKIQNLAQQYNQGEFISKIAIDSGPLVVAVDFEKMIRGC